MNWKVGVYLRELDIERRMEEKMWRGETECHNTIDFVQLT